MKGFQKLIKKQSKEKENLKKKHNKEKALMQKQHSFVIDKMTATFDKVSLNGLIQNNGINSTESNSALPSILINKNSNNNDNNNNSNSNNNILGNNNSNSNNSIAGTANPNGNSNLNGAGNSGRGEQEMSSKLKVIGENNQSLFTKFFDQISSEYVSICFQGDCRRSNSFMGNSS
jgi:hypothetical protein